MEGLDAARLRAHPPGMAKFTIQEPRNTFKELRIGINICFQLELINRLVVDVPRASWNVVRSAVPPVGVIRVPWRLANGR